MAINHEKFDDQKQKGRLLRQFLNTLEDMLIRGEDLFLTIQQMKDAGDVTQYIADEFGFQDVTSAEAAIGEFESAYAKFSGDGQVDTVNTALRQVCNRLR